MTNPFRAVEEKFANDQEGQIFRATVTGNVSNQVSFETDEGQTFSLSFPKLFGVSVIAGDEILVVRVGGTYVVLGKIVHN